MWEEFPPISTAEWEAAIRADLKGADYAKETGLADGRRNRRKAVLPARRFAGNNGAGTIYRRVEIQELRQIFQRTRYAAICCTSRVQRQCRKSGMHWQNRGASTMHFVFAVGSNYFMEIAKLRAARQLWARIRDADGDLVANLASEQEPVRPVSKSDAMHDGGDERDFWRMRLPGCGGGAIWQHLAESLPRVLGEESHFDQVSDPAGGSYYVEALTASIAAEAWKVYESGLAGREAAIAASRAAKEKAVAQRQADSGRCEQLSGFDGDSSAGDKLPDDSVAHGDPFEHIRVAWRKQENGRLFCCCSAAI